MTQRHPGESLLSPFAITLFGISLVFTLHAPFLPSWWMWLLVLLILVLSVWFGMMRMAAISMGILLALSTGLVYVHQRYDAPNKSNFNVTGTITSEVVEKGNSKRFVLMLEGAGVCASRSLPCRIRVSWYKPSPRLRAGQRWQLDLRVSAPWGYANPGGFDYAKWLYLQGLHATAYVRRSESNRKLAEGSRNWLQQYRYSLARDFDLITANTAHPGVLEALAFGIRDRMAWSTTQLLRETGTAHLLAISGMHIALVASMGFSVGFAVSWVAGSLLRLSKFKLHCGPPIRQSANRYWLAGLLSIFAASSYALISGFSVSTQRALIMVVLYFVLRFSCHCVFPRSVLLLSLLPVLYWQPTAPLSAGLWLSYGAVAAIGYLLTGRVVTGSRITALPRLQLRLSLMLLPMSLFFFAQGSVVSPVANLIAIPLVTFAVLPLVLAAVLGMPLLPEFSRILVTIADQLLQFLFLCLRGLSDLWFSDFTVSAMDSFTLFCLCSSVVLLFNPVSHCLKILGLSLLLPVMASQTSERSPGFRVHVLDVGQGLAVVVETSEHALVYDTGRGSVSGSAAQSVILPFLRSLGIEAPDRLIISHPDNDHAGGLAALRAAYPLLEVVTPSPFMSQLQAHRECAAGMHWSWDNVNFDVLYPAENTPVRFKDNDFSCVLMVSTGKSSVLLPGDIEARAELELLRQIRNRGLAPRSGLGTETSTAEGKLDLIVAPHHGSQSSSTQALLQHLSPRAVVYSVGRDNRYGFPHESVRMRYKIQGAQSFRTDQDGAISFSYDQRGAVKAPRRYRLTRRRLWSIHQ